MRKTTTFPNDPVGNHHLRPSAFPSVEEIGTDRLLIVHLTDIPNRGRAGAVYDRLRGNWKLDPTRAQSVDYVIAIHKGITQGVYAPSAPDGNWNWRPGYDPKKTDAYQFDGCPAPQEIWEKYIGRCGKYLTDASMRPRRNPVRYFRA